MGAPSAPPEAQPADVADPQNAVSTVIEAAAPAAEPAEATPPNPSETEGGDQAQPGGDTPAIDLAPAEAAIEAEINRRLAEREAELEAKAVQRAMQRKSEQDEGEQARLRHYDEAERAARAAAQTLRKAAVDGEYIAEDALDTHQTTIIAGALAMAARDNEKDIKGLIDIALPDATEAELAALDDAAYDFRRNGRLGGYLQKMFEAGMARRDAEIKDLQKQLRDRKAIQEAAALLAKGAEAAGPGAGSETIQGAATKSGPLTVEEASTLDISELVRRRQSGG